MSQVECQAILNGMLTDPIDFLSKNIIYMNMPPEGTPTRRLRRFDADALPGTPAGFGGAQGGGAIYSVQEDDNGGMIAHYLPWAPNTGYFIVLNHNSPFRLMFTAALSGCAVGVVWAADGSARVSHHNIVDGLITNDAAQRASLQFTHAALHRSRYRIDQVQSKKLALIADGYAHVHGVRRSDGWHFYVQVMRHYRSSFGGGQQFVIGEVGELRA